MAVRHARRGSTPTQRDLRRAPGVHWANHRSALGPPHATRAQMVPTDPRPGWKSAWCVRRANTPMLWDLRRARAALWAVTRTKPDPPRATSAQAVPTDLPRDWQSVRSVTEAHGAPMPEARARIAVRGSGAARERLGASHVWLVPTQALARTSALSA